MIPDKNLMMSDDQDIGQVVGTYLSDRSIDLWNESALPSDVLGNTVPSDPGKGNPVNVLVQITEAVVGTTSTVEFQLVMADNEALSSNLVVLQSTGAIAEATLVAGYQVMLGGTLPPGISKRFLGVRYLVAVNTTTAGKVTAFIASDKQTAPN